MFNQSPDRDSSKVWAALFVGLLIGVSLAILHRRLQSKHPGAKEAGQSLKPCLALGQSAFQATKTTQENTFHQFHPKKAKDFFRGKTSLEKHRGNKDSTRKYRMWSGQLECSPHRGQAFMVDHPGARGVLQTAWRVWNGLMIVIRFWVFDSLKPPMSMNKNHVLARF